MTQQRLRSRSTLSGTSFTRACALLLVICLVECATEQRISRGGKATNLLAKNNGWRATRGGSCLSYGHSCWGAHGKRSPKPPAAAPDWFIAKLLRNMDANNEMNRARPNLRADDANAIYPVDTPDYSPADRLGSEGKQPMPLDMVFNRSPEAKSMLDNDVITKLKLWRIMKVAATEE